MFDTEKACCEEHFPGQECIGNVSKPPTHQPTLPPTSLKPTTRNPTTRPSNPPSRPVTNAPTKMTRYPTPPPISKLILESQSSSYEIVQAVSNEIASPTMRPTIRIPASQQAVSPIVEAFMGSQASAFASMQTNSSPIPLPMKGQESSSQQSQILSLQAQIQNLKSSGELTMRQKQMLKKMRKQQMKLKKAAKRAQQKAMIARQQALAAKKAAQSHSP